MFILDFMNLYIPEYAVPIKPIIDRTSVILSRVINFIIITILYLIITKKGEQLLWMI